MKTTYRFKNVPAERLKSAAPVTREMVHARTRELAVLAGRPAAQISQGDYERARRELTGESNLERQDAVLDSAWSPAAPATRSQ